jgi:ribosomal protein L16/L10AE
MSKKNNSWRRSEKWPLGFLDETRKRIADEAAEGLASMEQNIVKTGKELKYTQGVVAGELSAFQAEHAERARNAVRKFVQKQVEEEKGRLRGMQRALAMIKVKGLPTVPIRRKRLEDVGDA